MKLKTLFLLLLTAGLSLAAVKTEEKTYTIGDVSFKGYLAYDDAVEGQRPGIIVVHEWWGHNAYARKRAEQLAALGYTAFALDMYGDGKLADHPKDAMKFMQETMSKMETVPERFDKALQILKEHPTVKPDQLGAIGYCFGGGVVLHMAAGGADLKGVVSFHGSLGADVKPDSKPIKAAILVCNGADDPFVTQEQIDQFGKVMQAAKVDYTFKNYAGAQHSFTNPEATAVGEKYEMPLVYSAKADEDSWADMCAFFKRVFGR